MVAHDGSEMPAAVIHHRDNYGDSTVVGAFLAVGTADAPPEVQRVHVNDGLGVRSTWSRPSWPCGGHTGRRG